jgi:hypothetical protein
MRLHSFEDMFNSHFRIVLHGLAGAGKTQTGIEYVHYALRQKKYRGYFWINADSKENIAAGLLQIAVALGLVERSEQDPQKIYDCLIGELGKEDDWLLVFDNLEQVDDLKDMLPLQAGSRHVLITTRYSEGAPALKAEARRLRNLEPDDSKKLFTVLLRAYYGSPIPPSDHSDEESIESLLNALGHLPLAITQTAAYLASSKDSIAEYVTKFEHSRRLWTWRPYQDKSYQSVAITLTISLRPLMSDDTAIRILCLLAFFNSTDVPDDLWTSNAGVNDRESVQWLEYADRLDDALQLLSAYQIIDRMHGNSSIHRLLQRIVRDILVESNKDLYGNILDKRKS